MKLSLTPRPVEPAPATSEPAAPAIPVRPSRALSLLARLVHPLVSIGIILLSIALVIWILSVRLPVLQKPLTVEAREVTTGVSLKPVPAEALAEWQGRAQGARTRLLAGQQELVDYVAEVERLAGQWGWRAEVSVRSGATAVSAAERLAFYAVSVRLEQAAVNPKETSAYLRLLELVRQIDFAQPKASLTDLQIIAGEPGISVAQLEFRFWAANADEKTAAK